MKTRSYTLKILKSLVHVTGKFEQETVSFDFAHNCPHCRREYHNTGCQVSWIARASRDVGCGMYGDICCRDTVVSLVFLFWFTEYITVVSWLCDETGAGSDMRLQSAVLWCKAQFVSFGPSMHTVQCLCCNAISLIIDID